ncbi:MAG: ATP-binding protein [Sphaerochaetaceae bacterium]|nr:ATP-binding protein [Sphaerochaetaceae bacterium]
MKEIVIISGKGGTGKTSITASFAYLGGKDLIVADCDVDAADMHLLMAPDFAQSQAFRSGQLSVIDPEQCIACGRCLDVCHFDAVSQGAESYTIDPIACEGCGYCARVCPVQAIGTEYPEVGNLFISQIRTGTTMVHARLGIGADNSGKLVAKVKETAKRLGDEQSKQAIIVDGSPGIGCPVVSSLSGAHYVVLVTEPTVSGFHDLKRVYELVHTFHIRAGCIINKADLNDAVLKELKAYLKKEGIDVLGEIPYDEEFTAAMTQGKTVIEYSFKIGQILSVSWENIKHNVGIQRSHE